MKAASFGKVGVDIFLKIHLFSLCSRETTIMYDF